MGHIRLGNLPRTHKWQQVVQLVGEGAATAEVAGATKNELRPIWLLGQDSNLQLSG